MHSLVLCDGQGREERKKWLGQHDTRSVLLPLWLPDLTYQELEEKGGKVDGALSFCLTKWLKL